MNAILTPILPPSSAEAVLRVLQRTACILASTPGGLRFVADSRPWLHGIPGGRVRTDAVTTSLSTERSR